MTEPEIIDLTRSMLWVCFIISVPILTVALITGLVIGLFQALTSIQEMTLTFVPKLAVMAVAFWITMGFMAGEIIELFQSRIIPLIGGG